MSYELQIANREEKIVNGIIVVETTYEILVQQITTENDGTEDGLRNSAWVGTGMYVKESEVKQPEPADFQLVVNGSDSGYQIWEPLADSEGAYAFTGIVIPEVVEAEGMMTAEELAAVIVRATSTCSYWPK